MLSMMDFITPVVHGGRARWRLALFAYGACAAITAAAFGALLGMGGRALRQQLPIEHGAVVLSIIVLVAAVHELGVVRIPWPQRRWQVPSSWRFIAPRWIPSALYGLLLGPGVLTYIPVATYYVLVAMAIFITDPGCAAAVFVLFAVAQLVPLYLVGRGAETFDAAAARITTWSSHRMRLHRVNGAFLVAVAVYLVWW
jgi:cytochrome c biogenesis protein CcdA